MVRGSWPVGVDSRVVVRGPWFVVRGSRAVVRGHRSAAPGSRPLVRGPWFAALGSWSVLRGPWFAGLGSRALAIDACTARRGPDSRIGFIEARIVSRETMKKPRGSRGLVRGR